MRRGQRYDSKQLMTQRRTFLINLSALAAMPLVCPVGFAHAATQSFDFSAEQKERVRAPKDAAASSGLAGYRFVTPGVLTVAISPYAAPIATYATDARSVVGSDPDYAQLVADALGLHLQLVPVAWADWPLGLTSGKFDAVISNVGVTEKRKQKFDFTTYRLGLHGFFVRTDSAIKTIREPQDIAGLRIITGSGTIQERILLEWNRRNVAHGLKEATLLYYEDEASARLALLSKRADAIFNPDAPLAYEATTQGQIRQVGTVNAGWPYKADVAIATRKDSGLAPALTVATNGLIRGGQYRAALARWGLQTEAIDRSETNPAGFPDA
ncbi:amino acid ABC transporter substrate-binding protein, PAAT family [Paraburkholderia megapolitana]|uniref:Amino acid ABC transporter substrate-binding protein, PAAT family n=2 Tax=Paraburkholderia megapolitana TaxID=420953 RepID=A0A1I3R8V0_9BURK|nr:amino acid ABC transporter substrate-binding protein, PAAT family [Paraburkholderia megapolitana]